MTFKLTTLHDQPDLLEEAALLLITEWPRSLEARKASIETSKSTFPCSILLVDVSDRDKVIGFARLLEVVGDKTAALVESVVVDPKLRGHGLGRKLMEACENHVTSLGMNSLHLSTHDKQHFYSHLGYNDGPIVSGVRHSAKSIQESLVSVVGLAENVSTANDACADVKQGESMEIVNQVAPPPPPPPPKLPVVSGNSILSMTWMVKYFNQNLI
ncbi:N-alpha-acetyltransferase 80-like [Dysidea avara]|uniref:N-alpha-acetyltransferase 80-like n=1 Tax=Dysidea avara TaxID=196820 RepID=UPI003321F631